MTTPAPLSPGEARAVRAIAVLVGLLGLVGFVNSFAAVARAAVPSFGALAWTVPLGIDVAIAVFSAADIVLARLGMRARWLRLVPWTLVAATIYLNVAPETTLVGRVAHTALPALWVIAVEVGAHATRVRAGLSAPTRMERVRRARWVLAPLSTAVLWRRMVLWETRSYDAALARERGRLLAQADMASAHGRLWRWRAPRRARVLYRLGELAPAPGADGGAPAPHRVQEDAPALHLVRGSDPAAPSGRAALADIVASLPEGDPRTNTDLANQYAHRCGLSPTTARRYVGEMRGAR